MIDQIITSKPFNLIPDFIKWLWSPITKRQKFLYLRDLYETFNEHESRAYAEIYGDEAAEKKHPEFTRSCRSVYIPNQGPYQTHCQARSHSSGGRQ